jgi:hypothetical protein
LRISKAAANQEAQAPALLSPSMQFVYVPKDKLLYLYLHIIYAEMFDLTLNILNVTVSYEAVAQ